MTIFFMCKVMFYQLLSELLLITQGPPTTWRLPGWSQILAGEVERSDLEEAVGDNLPLRVSWLQESSSYHMPEDIQSCWAGSGQWPNGLIAKGGHRGCSLFSFSKTGSWGRLCGTRHWRWYRSQGWGRCSCTPAMLWHCKALGTRGMLRSGYWERGSRRMAASRQWRSLGCKETEKLGKGFTYSFHYKWKWLMAVLATHYAGSFTYTFHVYTRPMSRCD